MKFISSGRILREDLKEAPSWIEKLLSPLNSFMENVKIAMNRNITFSENISCIQKTMDFQTASDYTTAGVSSFSAVKFPNNMKRKAFGCILVQIQEKTSNYNPISTTVTMDWIEINEVIYINFITGLKNSTNYTINVLVF